MNSLKFWRCVCVFKAFLRGEGFKGGIAYTLVMDQKE